MLKVLIVDDEEKVCQLIYHLIDWEQLELELAGVFHDGQAAKDYILNDCPDIVITDIRMPNCDGLEMIRLVREQFPEIHFIIISGYNNFEYAKNAIHYGVEDYLLKPLEERELNATLEKICEKHKFTAEQKTKQKMWKDMAETSREKVRGSLITELILNPEKLDLGHMETINKEYQCKFAKGYFRVLKIQPFIRGYRLSGEELRLILAKVQQILKERLESCCNEMLIKSVDSCVWCILNTKDNSWDEIERQLKRMRLDILNLKNIFQELKVYNSIGGSGNDLQAAVLSMQQAELAMSERIVRPGQYLLEYEASMLKKEGTIRLYKQWLEELFGYMELFDLNGIAGTIDQLRNEIGQQQYSGAEIEQCYREITAVFIRWSEKTDDEEQLPGEDYFLQQYHTYLTVDDVFCGLKDGLGTLIRDYHQRKKTAQARPILLARQYIGEHYNQPLSLERVSEQVGFNPAYFSTLFKKETGKNFMEYITELRIHNAKQRLVTSAGTLADIALEVGYSDFKYFAKVFKRITGLTPSEYRKLYS